MIRRDALLVLAAVAMLCLPGATPQVGAADRDDQAPLACLKAFWAALSAGDAVAFEAVVDFPLTLQDLNDDGTPGVRCTVTRENWPQFKAAFPAQPEGGPVMELTAVRLDWVGDGLAVVCYSVGPAGEPAARQTATLVNHNGWKVVFATLPADEAPEPPVAPQP